MAKRVGISLALVMALGVGAVAAAGALAVHIPPTTLFKLSMSVSPHELPKVEAAPAALSIRGRISTSDGSAPAESREAVAEFDKSWILDSRRLAVCSAAQLEAAGLGGRKACRDAIVGTGSAEVVIAAGHQTIPIQLTLFNGGVQGGVARILIQSSVTEVTPQRVVVVVEIKKKRGGWSGSLAKAKIPPLDDSQAALVGFDLRIKRLFRYKGSSESYLSASCPGGQLHGQMKFTFANGAFAQSMAAMPCG